MYIPAMPVRPLILSKPAKPPPLPIGLSTVDQTDAAFIAAMVREEDPIYAFQLLPNQRPIINSEAPIVIVFGGNRPGKSDTGAYWMGHKYLSKPARKVWCCTVDEPLSIRVQQAKIHSIIPKRLRTPLPDSPKNFYYNYSPHTGFVNNKFVLNNGTTCEFKFYSQDVKSFQGEGLDAIWFDEVPPLEHYSEATVRLWDRGGRALMTGTATEGITPYVKEILVDARTLATRYAPLIHRNLPVHQISNNNQTEIFYLWTTDNPHIDQKAVLAKVRTYSQTEIELRIYGVPSNIQGLVYPTFSTAIHVRPTPPFPSGQVTLLHGLDPHDRKPWCLGWYVYIPAPHNQLHVVAEFPDFMLKDRDAPSQFSITDYVRFVRLIEAQLGWPEDKVRRVIDPNKGNTPVVTNDYSEKIIHLLSRKGLYYTPAQDALVEGHMEVRDLLAYDITEPISEKNEPRLFFDPKCKNHIYQFSNYEYSDHASEKKEIEDGPREAPQQAHKDFPDLVRYIAMYLRSHTPPANRKSVSTVETKRRRTVL